MTVSIYGQEMGLPLRGICFVPWQGGSHVPYKAIVALERDPENFTGNALVHITRSPV